MGEFLSVARAVWESIPDGAVSSIRALVEGHPELLKAVGEVATLLSYLEQSALKGGTLESLSGTTEAPALPPKDILAMAILSEYVIDDLLILPRELREARLTELADEAGVEKELLRGFALRWHSVYKKLLSTSDG